MTAPIPETQHAIQLIGPDELTFNAAKPVILPGPHQVLARVEAVGLCFSDLKLLKQFHNHARKTKILSGIDPEVLSEISSYAPDDKPTVPGHESVVRIVAVGEGVADYKVSERYLVQTDYRWLPTANSNASFGYNFEGGLQEYVLMDERIITSPQGDSMLIPVSQELSASAVALIEPWACVENAYAAKDRRGIKKGGKMLIVSDNVVDNQAVDKLLNNYGKSGDVVTVDNIAVEKLVKYSDAEFDDVVYFGSEAEIAEALFSKVGPRGLLNIALCGGSFGKAVVSQVGRVHYGGIRIIGTTTANPSDSMATIPQSGEIRLGDNINIVGAGGPMGVMHVVRNICQGVPDITVYAGDVSDDRLAILTRLSKPLAQKNNVTYKAYNPKTDNIDIEFDYTSLMAPIPALVSQAVLNSAENGLINIFAGIPATVSAEIDLNAYIAKRLYFIGTSGSVLDDMKRVLANVETGRLDTNLSVAAVAGLDQAVEGIRAVENHKIPGKIIVYPSCKGLELTELGDLSREHSDVADCLADDLWTGKAEKALLAEYTR